MKSALSRNEIDPQALRAEMPLTRNGYFNNAAASLMSRSVRDAVLGHLVLESEIGAYEAARQSAELLDDLYGAIAEMLRCDVDEIALTDSHSRGWASVIGAMQFGPGDRILVSRSEWGGNYAVLSHIARTTGAVVEVMPCDQDGAVCVEEVGSMLDERVKLMAMTWLPANGGLVNPAASVGALARAAGIPFVLDAAQAVGQMPVDVRALNCDALTAPGRKWLRGPRGTGFLYVRREFLKRLRPRTVDHFSAPWNGSGYQAREDARLFETSESSVALRLGLRTAIREALSISMEVIQERVTSLADALRSSLAEVNRVRILDLGRERSGLVSFCVDGVAAATVQERLQDMGQVVAVNGTAFTPLDMQARGLAAIVRASPQIYTTDDEVTKFVEAVRRCAAS